MFYKTFQCCTSSPSVLSLPFDGVYVYKFWNFISSLSPRAEVLARRASSLSIYSKGALDRPPTIAFDTFTARIAPTRTPAALKTFLSSVDKPSLSAFALLRKSRKRRLASRANRRHATDAVADARDAAFCNSRNKRCSSVFKASRILSIVFFSSLPSPSSFLFSAGIVFSDTDTFSSSSSSSSSFRRGFFFAETTQVPV